MSLGICNAMNVAKTIADIELLEHIFTLPDNRRPSGQDCVFESEFVSVHLFSKWTLKR